MNSSKTVSGSFPVNDSSSIIGVVIASTSSSGIDAPLAIFSISFWSFLIESMYELCIFWKLWKYFSDVFISDLHTFNTALRTFSSFFDKVVPSIYYYVNFLLKHLPFSFYL